MRISASIYDNLRQPGVYDELDRSTGGHADKMRRAILTRLRLDDLMTNVSNENESRIVLSITDVLDGRLFTLVTPTQLRGIEFEIRCHPSIAKAAPQDVVPMVLSSWIHDRDGNGRPGGFLAVGEKLHRHVAEVLPTMRNLKVNNLSAAKSVAIDAGIPATELYMLFELWDRWDSAIRNKRVILRPWGAVASGEPLLRRFLQKHETYCQIPEFGLTEVGTNILHAALDLLAESQGRRDSPIKFLLNQIDNTTGEERVEVLVVHQLFMHHTFSAIARSNDAMPEFTESVGECDNALTAEHQYLIEEVCEKRHPVNIDSRIISGLGDLDASEYVAIKDEVAPKLHYGIENYIKTTGSDVGKLHSALDFLATEIGKTTSEIGGGLFRKIIFTGLAGFVGSCSTLDFVLGQGDSVSRALIGGAITSAATAAGLVESTIKTSCEFRLLKKSLIRTFEEELRDHTTKAT